MLTHWLDHPHHIINSLSSPRSNIVNALNKNSTPLIAARVCAPTKVTVSHSCKPSTWNPLSVRGRGWREEVRDENDLPVCRESSSSASNSGEKWTREPTRPPLQRADGQSRTAALKRGQTGQWTVLSEDGHQTGRYIYGRAAQGFSVFFCCF